MDDFDTVQLEAVSQAPPKKRRRPSQRDAEFSSFIQTSQKEMPEGIKKIARKGSELEKIPADGQKKKKKVSAYDVSIPEGTDPFRWHWQNCTLPVRRYQVEIVGYPDFAPLQIWEVDDVAAVAVFHEYYRIKNPEQYKYRAIESPPEPQGKTKSAKGEPKTFEG